jgi:aminoglycoside/choline kinase family phosphotransferase
LGKIENKLISLFKLWKGYEPLKIEKLPPSGSVRVYFRIFDKHDSYIGAFNENYKENKAFIAFSKHFFNKALKVPEIYAENLDEDIYIQEDLGDITLFSYLSNNRKSDEFSEQIVSVYKDVLKELVKFQFDGHEGLDYSIGYPRAKFDKQSMLWDLNYFKHYFVKLAGLNFHEQNLEDDFHSLIEYLLDTDTNYFMYRDFQSRNIMLRDNDIYFIDYQGGRKGALQYDLASLLFDAKANIPNNIRLELFDFYFSEINKIKEFDYKKFKNLFFAYTLIRIMQAFGAYGYRGFFERKQHFLLSIPFAVNNLKWILENIELHINIPTLDNLFTQIINSPNLKEFEYVKKPGLTVLVNSFSYKRSIPLDNSGNGGGFVFDCRFLPNPGRDVYYKDKTGLDAEVIDYFRNYPEVDQFVDRCFEIVKSSITNYLERSFSHLMVSFGCTGGQHRSVYCANAIAEKIKKTYDINIEIRHIEQEIKKTVQ